MARANRKFRRNDATGLVWTAASTAGTQVLSDGGDFTFPVVDVENDLSAAAGQVQCTLLRIRGWVNFIHNDPSSAGQRVIMAGAAVVDTSEVGLLDWLNIVTYVREDVLWTGGAMRNIPSNVTIDEQLAINFDIDIKSKRRLRSGQVVVVSFSSNFAAGTEMAVAGALRALVKLR